MSRRWSGRRFRIHLVEVDNLRQEDLLVTSVVHDLPLLLLSVPKSSANSVLPRAFCVRLRDGTASTDAR